MATADPSRTAAHPAWVLWLTRNHRASAYLFLALAAGFAVLTGLTAYWYRLDYWAVTFWAGALALVAAFAGLWQLLREPAAEPNPADTTRTMVLVTGGLAGLATALLGLLLPIFHWLPVITGGLETWRAEWWRVARVLLALFGGLALMFVSLQLARASERTSPWLRRLLYGYNAVLGGLLLFFILLVFNVLAYARDWPFKVFNTTFDWTTSQIYTLSPKSVNVLESLTEEKPVKLYVILPHNDFFVYQEMRTLIENVQGITNTGGKKVVEAEYLSPDVHFARLAELNEKYQLPARAGMLVVYGREGSPEAQSEFVKLDEIVGDVNAPRDEGLRFVFKGEDALMRALVALREGKSKAVVYFTQGHGEPGLNERGFDRADLGLAELKDRLERANYEVKELRFAVGVDKVPDDAAVVVVAHPTSPLSRNALQALRTYMNPPEGKTKGKMVVIADVLADREGKPVQTGLEGLLAEFNVRLGNDRILRLDESPTEVRVMANQRARNPVAQAFKNTLLLMENARTVQEQPQGPNPGGQRYQVEVLLHTLPGEPVWAESNLGADPSTLVRDLVKPARLEELRQKVTGNPLPVAVAVSEGGAANDPHAFMRPPEQRNQQPRLVVYGDASWVSNRIIGGRFGRYFADLFASNLAWLRERPDVGPQAEPKARQEFTLNVAPEQLSRVAWLPLGLMMVIITGLGAGIWVVRRR